MLSRIETILGFASNPAILVQKGFTFILTDQDNPLSGDVAVTPQNDQEVAEAKTLLHRVRMAAKGGYPVVMGAYILNWKQFA